MRTVTRSILAILVLCVGCRGKEPDAPAAAARPATGAATKRAGGRWSAVIEAGDAGGLHGLVSGEAGTVVAVARGSEQVTVDGATVLAASAEEGEGFILLDRTGKVTDSKIIDRYGGLPPLLVGRSDWLLGITRPNEFGKGSIATFPSGERTPVTGEVRAIARTDSGALWTAGSRWGNQDPITGRARCDRKTYVARGTSKEVSEVIGCSGQWRSMRLVALGDDVVFCGSQFYSPGSFVGTDDLKGTIFLVRIGSDGKVKWTSPVAELGNAACDGVVVTSDGDIVAAGTAADNVDFTPDAIAKGITAKPSGGGRAGDVLWMARFSPDGARRWARTIGRTILGDEPSLSADHDGNALVSAIVAQSFDFGKGPVGSDHGVVVATIDRDANVRGLLAVNGATSPRAAVDADSGLILGFTMHAPVDVAGVTVKPKDKLAVAVVRVPLPLPAP